MPRRSRAKFTVALDRDDHALAKLYAAVNAAEVMEELRPPGLSRRRMGRQVRVALQAIQRGIREHRAQEGT